MTEIVMDADGLEVETCRVDRALTFALRWSLRGAALFAPLSIAVAQICTGLATAAWLAARVRGVAPGWPRTRVDVPIAAFLACGLFSAAVGLDPAKSILGLHSYLWVVLFHLVLANVTDDRERKVLVGLLLAGLTLSAYHRLANHLYNDDTPNHPPHPWMKPRWFPGKMTRANQLMLGLPLAHALCLGAHSRRARVGLGLVSGMLGVGLLATLKRAASVAAVVALGAQWWVRRRWMVAVLIAASLTLGFGYEPMRTRLMRSAYDFFENPDNRGHMWAIGWALLEEHPLGIGTGNSGVMSERIWEAGVEPPHHKHFHSNPITIAVEDGWLGLAAWTWWMAVLMVALARRARAATAEGDFARAMALGVVTGLGAWHLSGLTEFNFGDSEVMLVLFLVTGLTLGMGPEIRRGPPAPIP